MIPRLKPAIGIEELLALFHSPEGSVELFEHRFAQTFQVKHALAFPYGRSALWTFFKSMGFEGTEVVQPAYTCSVVGHATVLSSNSPRFVDIDLWDYNMNLERFREAINPHTHVVIPTHLFGYPMNIHEVERIIKESEEKFGHKIFIVQDCAHSFEAEWRGQSVIHSGDGALFGLGISKQITSVFGGMFTTNDERIANKMRSWRDNHFSTKKWVDRWKRRLYLMAASIAFNPHLYNVTFWLQENSKILKGLTDAYHLDEKIHFPPDFKQELSILEAAVGNEQLSKYPTYKRERKEIADYYFNHLHVPGDWILPPRIEGATYSHFVIRVPDRKQVLQAASEKGVQLGKLIEYSMPHLSAYQKYNQGEAFPNSLLCSQVTINLPIYPGLNRKELEKIIRSVSNI